MIIRRWIRSGEIQVATPSGRRTPGNPGYFARILRLLVHTTTMFLYNTVPTYYLVSLKSEAYFVMVFPLQVLEMDIDHLHLVKRPMTDRSV